MASYNRLELIGNLGADPIMKFSKGGKPTTSFSVASNFVQHDLEGERDQETLWITIITWNKLAEQCNQFLAKGRTVFAEGRLRFVHWTGTDGKEHYRNELVAGRVIFLDKREAIERDENGDEESGDDIFNSF